MSRSLVCLKDFEEEAQHAMPKSSWDYYASGANDEETMADNEAAFDRYLLRPRVLRDVSRINTRCKILGSESRSPICLAPSAMHRMAHEDGEEATAKGKFI
jgi:(S)-2-hydroxy-acid oxidase